MRIWSNGMTTGCQSVSGSSILPIRTKKQILKDIQSVDNQSPINKGIFSISVDKYGDMCIKGHKNTVLHLPDRQCECLFSAKTPIYVSYVTFYVNHVNAK